MNAIWFPIKKILAKDNKQTLPVFVWYNSKLNKTIIGVMGY